MENYIDIYGDKWRRVSDKYVERLRDGNIGGYFGGKGLYPLPID